MIKAHCIGTDITIMCKTPEELHTIYCCLGSRFDFTIEPEVVTDTPILEHMGPRDTGAYFAGYTQSYMKRFFKDQESASL